MEERAIEELRGISMDITNWAARYDWSEDDEEIVYWVEAADYLIGEAIVRAARRKESE